MLLKTIQEFPIGYSKVSYKHKTYGVTRTDFNNGSSIKIYAEELGGTDFISLNYYITSRQELLKPCEMPIDKIIHFLKNHSAAHED
ncbi:peptide methionine sulfoxide reductase [Winogradskyella ursingii]|uniref:peptide methionine sulfoxide reductase n=1 Tax=Winogradskyella ursingii TaxID=2686079 RepID=UPI0015CBDD1C|nr:peptide methionine sulfoxide reductase [Winogradskyella ursingii]